MKRTSTLVISCAVLSPALLAACGGSSYHDPASKPPVAVRLTAGELMPLLVTAHDLPSGYAGSDTTSDDDPEIDRKLVSCVGTADTNPDELATINSQDFTLGSRSISSTATSYKSEADVRQDEALLRSPKFTACYKSATLSSAVTEQGYALSKIDILRTLDPVPGHPDVVGEVLSAGTITLNGAYNNKVVDDTYYLIGPQRELTVTFFDMNGERLPDSLRTAVVTAISARNASTEVAGATP